MTSNNWSIVPRIKAKQDMTYAYSLPELKSKVESRHADSSAEFLYRRMSRERDCLEKNPVYIASSQDRYMASLQSRLDEEITRREYPKLKGIRFPDTDTS